VKPRLLSPYEHRASPVHRLPAAAKIAFVGALVCTVVLVPLGAGMIYAVCAAALVVVAALARLPARHLAWRLLLLEPFVLGVAALSLLQPGGGRVFVAMLVRSTVCLFAMVLLASTTRFTDVLAVLWRLRVPALLVTSLALMYRYLSLLVDETGRLQRARRSRTFADGRAFAWRSSAAVAAHLFVRTSERAERVYDAMCARGWRT
jgi:cobalt/nickel transport system permease protein